VAGSVTNIRRAGYRNLMKYTCVECHQVKYVSTGYLTRKERATGEITCGRCRRLKKEVK
jgi:transcription elongation factor Elf1